MIRTVIALLALAVLPVGAQAAPAKPALVSLQTDQGTIVVSLETKRAPLTSANFLRYVDEKRLDGTSFYRAARTPRTKGWGFIQGGIHHSMTRALPPVPHEPTTKTGLTHGDGTISMARNDPGTAMGDFFITIGPAAAMDAHPGKPGDNLGFAAFGHVVKGMDVVRKILAEPTVKQAATKEMKDQMLAKPVRIIAAKRVAS